MIRCGFETYGVSIYLSELTPSARKGLDFRHLDGVFYQNEKRRAVGSVDRAQSFEAIQNAWLDFWLRLFSGEIYLILMLRFLIGAQYAL
ncbi:hypothetical protein RRG08_057163 [Elysia crispata]|uniref:Uncharacterized protein n=1 Tax=Elysia crispata TaxID=231223 RepID=A0AAE1E116_9GAST|nr:hypothetical protein RRG08_057163 [Elysia crispata]